MAHEILVDRKSQLITIRYSATVGVHDLRDAVRDVFAIDPGYRVRSDFTGVESWGLSKSELLSLFGATASNSTIFEAARRPSELRT